VGLDLCPFVQQPGHNEPEANELLHSVIATLLV
jgi:hypothetical protein